MLGIPKEGGHLFVNVLEETVIPFVKLDLVQHKEELLVGTETMDYVSKGENVSFVLKN